MKKTIFLLLTIFAFALTSCFNKTDSKAIEQDEALQQKIEIQEAEIQKQNERIIQQEKIEKERKQKEDRELHKQKVSEVLNSLYANYARLDVLKNNLNDATSFKLLRSSSKRNEEINEAQNAVDGVKKEIEYLENELDKLEPNWRKTN